MRTRLLLSALVAGTALVLAGAAAGDTAYADPAGDSTTAPDITTVAVSNDAAGTITFKITTNQPTQSTDSYLDIYFNTDQNGSTGSGSGSEYNIERDGSDSTYGTYMWDGSKWAVAPGTTVHSNYSAGIWTVTLNKSEIGNLAVFDFWVGSSQYSGTTELAFDDAPNAGYYTYTLTASLPAASVSLGAPTAAGAIRAGAAFKILASVHASAGGATVTCLVKAGTKVVASAGKLVGTNAVCSGKVPVGTRGKRLTGRVTATIAGAKATKAFSFAIK